MQPSKPGGFVALGHALVGAGSDDVAADGATSTEALAVAVALATTGLDALVVTLVAGLARDAAAPAVLSLGAASGVPHATSHTLTKNPITVRLATTRVSHTSPAAHRPET